MSDTLHFWLDRLATPIGEMLLVADGTQALAAGSRAHTAIILSWR